MKPSKMYAGMVAVAIALCAGCQGDIEQFEREEVLPESPAVQGEEVKDDVVKELPDEEEEEIIIDVPPVEEDGGTCGAPDPTPLRRLSHFEYWHSLRALYPDATFEEVALPADDRPHEFDNDAEALTVSSLLVERYLDVSSGVVEALQSSGAFASMTECGATAASAEALESCGETFLREEGERLFRRPLDDTQVEKYGVFFEEDFADATFEERQSLTMRLLLSAPEFLYRFEAPSAGVEPGESVALDDWALASRLSYFLWASGPDEELRELARQGELSDPDVLRAQAERMLDDERSRDVFVHMHEQWLDMEMLEGVTKFEEDGFTTAVREAMETQGLMFIEQVLYEDRGTVADLFSSTRTFVNADLAPIYGVDAPEQGWEELNLERRTGWLTQPAFLASHAHPNTPSPVLRGTFVLKRVLCRSLGAPPPNAESAGEEIAEGLSGPMTNRQRYELTTNSRTECSSCHVDINPPGYAMERFDTMGRFVEGLDPSGLEIDTRAAFGAYDFGDVQEFSGQLAASDEVDSCATKKWLRYAWSGGVVEASSCLSEQVLKRAKETSASSVGMRDIQLALVTHPWFSIYTAPSNDQVEEEQ